MERALKLHFNVMALLSNLVVATFSLTYAVRQHFIMVLVQVLIKGFDLLSGSISLIELVIKSILRNQFFV